MKTNRSSVIIRDGKLYVKFSYHVGTERKQPTRRALDRADADRIIRQLEIEHCQVTPAAPVYQTSAAPSVQPASITFLELATFYRKTKLIPARYVGEKKICGMRNPNTPGYLVGQCVQFFGRRPIDSITPLISQVFGST
jgi:hypothetical protein